MDPEDVALILACQQDRLRLLKKAHTYMDMARELKRQANELSHIKLSEKFEVSYNTVRDLSVNPARREFHETRQV